MAGFVYFVEGRQGLRPEELNTLGLKHVADGAGFKRAPGQAPARGRAAGLYLCDSGGDLTSLSELRWEPYPGSPTVLVGWDSKSPPGPEDLRRGEQLDGHEVELAGGRRWLVPVARYPRGDTPLPRRLQWDGKAWADGEIEERFRELWVGAERVWGEIVGAAEGDGAGIAEVTLGESADLASLALSINYRVGPGELSLLGLLTTANQADVVLSVVDWPSVKLFLKGAPPLGNSEGPGCEPGPEASSPATPQPSQNLR